MFGITEWGGVGVTQSEGGTVLLLEYMGVVVSISCPVEVVVSISCPVEVVVLLLLLPPLNCNLLYF